LIDLFTGENYQPAFTSINPNQAVPFLVDGDFQLAECSAIMKYLADKVHATSYPDDLRARARVNERMDWFNTGLYRDLGYGLVYPQVIDSYRRGDEQAHRQHLAWSRAKANRWLDILDRQILGGKTRFVCGGTCTLADFMGACYVSLGDLIRLDYSAYRNIIRWLDEMKSLPYWNSTQEAYYTHFVCAFKDKPFEGL